MHRSDCILVSVLVYILNSQWLKSLCCERGVGISSPQASIVLQDIVTVEIVPGANLISKELANS